VLGWLGVEGGERSDPTPSNPSICCEERALGKLIVGGGGGDRGDSGSAVARVKGLPPGRSLREMPRWLGDCSTSHHTKCA
jgi:hypothetical protein